MQQALQLVLGEGVPVRAAARAMGVPRWTLRNRIMKGKQRPYRFSGFVQKSSLLSDRQLTPKCIGV